MDKSAHGFTLVELLVIISIIVVLVILVLPQFGNFNKSQSLKVGVEQLQANLRFTQNNAVSGVQCIPNLASANWHIKFINNNTYLVENTCVNSEVDVGVPTPTPPVSKTYSLPNGVEIKDFTLDTNTPFADGYTTPLRVEFGNISGAVNFINTGGYFSAANSILKITLWQTSDHNSTASVIIEKGGSIYVSSQ